MAAMTITEALAELKTLGKRIEKKREQILNFTVRVEGIKDPLAISGGSVEWVRRERQAIADLETRHVRIRTLIQQINQQTLITVEGVTKTLAEWLTWRKEVAPGQQQFVTRVQTTIAQSRKQALSRGQAVVSVNQTPQQATDLLVNVDEGELAKEAELLETILGGLDGQLSLKNATVTIDL